MRAICLRHAGANAKMTRIIYDEFAKNYLSELLSPIGTVTPSRDVNSEVREIDVYFTPGIATADYLDTLGILGKMARTTALFEAFRNPATISEVRSCTSKLFNAIAEVERRSRREETSLPEAELPMLWILTPTASDRVLNWFKATPDEDNWGKGIYFTGEGWRTAIVVIHQLPVTEATLWLRILGRGKVQERAIAQLSELSTDNPIRAIALELAYQLQSNLRTNQERELEPEDRELIMAIAPLFREQLEAAKLEGREEGIEQGIEIGREEGQRLILANFLRVRFGELDAPLTAFLVTVSALPASEFALLLLQLSALPVNEEGIEQARRLLAENVLKMRFGELGERLNDLVSNLLALSGEELGLLLEQLPELSDESLLARLANENLSETGFGA